jgi:hypothetical protein
MLKFSPLIALVLVGCAIDPPQPQLVRATASGLAEGTFHRTTIPEIQSKFAAACVKQGRTVDNLNAMQISCFHDAIGLRAETWRYTTTWTMVQAGTDVHASAEALLGYPGGPKSSMRGDNVVTNQMQATLFKLGAD